MDIKLDRTFAKNVNEALTTVLDNCDVHSDEAVHLEVLRDLLEYHIVADMPVKTFDSSKGIKLNC